MSAPDGFTWVDKPYLAAMARPMERDEYRWLRENGVQLVISLTEDAPPRHWINDTGLFSVHVPVEDMTAPTQGQLDQVMSVVEKARAREMGVAIHCTAGLGRTGTALACYFVRQGLGARDAVNKVRRLRPGSIETEDQVDAVTEYARRRKMQDEFQGP